MTPIGLNQGALKSTNEANLLAIKDEQMATNHTVIDYQQNFELCKQIITNFDEELKRILEKDQQLITVEKSLYKLPIKPEHSVHNILNEYEKFSLRMLLDTSSKLTDFEVQTKQNEPKDSLSNNQAIHQTSSSHFISSNSSCSSGAASLGCPNLGKNHSKDTNVPLTSSNSMPNSFSNQTIREFASSIKIYFNTLTEKMFLFYSEEEKEQYQQLKLSISPPVVPCGCLGFVHLLRLIILLPDFLSICSMPTKHLKQLVFILKHFCNYLVENKFKFMP